MIRPFDSGMPLYCRYLLLAFLLFLAALPTVAQDVYVSNVRFELVDSVVQIKYDLVAEKPQTVDVSVSLDGGVNFLPLTTVSGDVGGSVRPGIDRLILWDVLKDFPNGITSAEVVFDVSVPTLEQSKSKRVLLYIAGAVVAGAAGTISLLSGGNGDTGSGTGGDPGSGATTTVADPPVRPSGN